MYTFSSLYLILEFEGSILYIVIFKYWLQFLFISVSFSFLINSSGLWLEDRIIHEVFPGSVFSDLMVL